MRKILFFDTETSGLPKNYKAPATDTANWPFICQLAWIVADEDGNILKECSELVHPTRRLEDGTRIEISIEPHAEAVHGHSIERLKAEGKDNVRVLMALLIDLADSDLIVCHNLAFDAAVLACEFIRAGILGEKKPKFCTMNASTMLCKIPHSNGKGYKWPKLEELHRFLFNENFDGAHDALADIRATVRCYFEMRRIGVAVPI